MSELKCPKCKGTDHIKPSLKHDTEECGFDWHAYFLLERIEALRLKLADAYDAGFEDGYDSGKISAMRLRELGAGDGR